MVYNESSMVNSNTQALIDSIMDRLRLMQDDIQNTRMQAAAMSLENTANSVDYFEEKLEDTSQEIKNDVDERFTELNKDASEFMKHLVIEAVKPAKAPPWKLALITFQVIFDVGAITYIVLERLGMF